MPATPSTRLGLVGPLGTETIALGDDNIRALITQLEAVGAAFIVGTAAARVGGDATKPGLFYIATDTGVVSVTTGSAWIDINPANTYQPLDSDLTAIAALATTSYGRSVLTRADAAALRTLAGLVIGTDVQAHDADLDAIAAVTTTSFGRAILALADAAAARVALSTTPDVQYVINGTATWVKPTSGRTMVRVITIGAGAGGGSGRRGAAASARYGGGGGGAGSMMVADFVLADLSSTYDMWGGTGGAGGAAQTVNDTNGSNGSNGTASFLVDNSTGQALAQAVGGVSGKQGTAANGLGGTATTSPQDVPGGAGADASITTNSPAAAANGPGGGGSGGSISAADGLITAGAGGACLRSGATQGGAAAPGTLSPGAGGHGGAASKVAAATQGTALDNGLGGGGGGGGASLNGFASGAGRQGGHGACIVIAY